MAVLKGEAESEWWSVGKLKNQKLSKDCTGVTDLTRRSCVDVFPRAWHAPSHGRLSRGLTCTEKLGDDIKSAYTCNMTRLHA